MAGIPIDLSRYTPQAVGGQQGAPISADRMFANGLGQAAAMARGGQALAAGLGDLATGVDRLGDGLRIRQEKIDREQALADEAGSVAHLNGVVGVSMEKIRKAENVDVLDQFLADAKKQTDGFRTGKSAAGLPNLQNAKSRQAFDLHSQQALGNIDAAVKVRKEQIAHQENLAKFDSEAKALVEMGVDDVPMSRQGFSDLADRMAEAGVMPKAGAVRDAWIEKQEAKAAFFAAETHLSRVPELPESEAALKSWKAETRKKLEEVAAMAPRGSMPKFEQGLEQQYEAARRRMVVEDGRVADEYQAEFAQAAADLEAQAVTGAVDELSISGYEERYDQLAQAMRTPEGKERIAAHKSQAVKFRAFLDSYTSAKGRAKIKEAETQEDIRMVDVEVAAVLGREKLAEVQAGIKRRLDSPDLLITKREGWLDLSKRIDGMAAEKVAPLLKVGLERLDVARKSGLFGSVQFDGKGRDVTDEKWRKSLKDKTPVEQAAIERQRLSLEAEYVTKVRQIKDWVESHPDANQDSFNKWYDENIISASSIARAQAAATAAWSGK